MKIFTKKPRINGMYVCYLQPDKPYPYPTKKLLVFCDGDWTYPSSDQKCTFKILGYVGPLPSPTIDKLENKIKGNYIFAITSPDDVVQNRYHYGPFYKLKKAKKEFGVKGIYIFKITDGKDPKAVCYWDDEKLKWRDV